MYHEQPLHPLNQEYQTSIAGLEAGIVEEDADIAQQCALSLNYRAVADEMLERLQIQIDAAEERCLPLE